MRTAAAVPALSLLVVGCGGGDPRAAVFNAQQGASVACMAHQQSRPNTAYRTASPGSGVPDAEAVFAMLHYYTVNGDKPYCDGRGPSATDDAWLHLFVAQGADPSHVARYLGSAG